MSNIPAPTPEHSWFSNTPEWAHKLQASINSLQIALNSGNAQLARKAEQISDRLEHYIKRKDEDIMAQVQVDDQVLVQLDTDLKAAVQSVSDRITALVNAGTLPAGDVSALQADLATLQGLEVPAVPPTPAPTP